MSVIIFVGLLTIGFVLGYVVAKNRHSIRHHIYSKYYHYVKTVKSTIKRLRKKIGI